MKYHISLFKGKKETPIELTLFDEKSLIAMLKNGCIFFTNYKGHFEYYNLANYDKMIIKEGMVTLDTEIYYNLINEMRSNGNEAKD